MPTTNQRHVHPRIALGKDFLGGKALQVVLLAFAYAVRSHMDVCIVMLYLDFFPASCWHIMEFWSKEKHQNQVKTIGILEG